MSKFRLMMGTAATLAVLACSGAANAAPAGIRVGDLTCNVASGWGFVFGSSKDLHCTYRGNNHREHYIGSISKFGVDIGANALIGGLDKSIALQPLSVEGSKGLNVAAGIGSISLKSAP
jgi:hypothetical protein